MRRQRLQRSARGQEDKVESPQPPLLSEVLSAGTCGDAKVIFPHPKATRQHLSPAPPYSSKCGAREEVASRRHPSLPNAAGTLGAGTAGRYSHPTPLFCPRGTGHVFPLETRRSVPGTAGGS